MKKYYKLFEAESGIRYHEHWWALSYFDAARRAFEHAQEMGINLRTISVSSMTEPESPQQGGGLVYVVNDTRIYRMLGKKITRRA